MRIAMNPDISMSYEPQSNNRTCSEAWLAFVTIGKIRILLKT